MITMKTINASDLAQRDAFFESLDKRTGETNQRVTETVSEIIRTVKTGGDEAVKNYTLKFDGSLLSTTSTERCHQRCADQCRSGVCRRYAERHRKRP